MESVIRRSLGGESPGLKALPSMWPDARLKPGSFTVALRAMKGGGMAPGYGAYSIVGSRGGLIRRRRISGPEGPTFNVA